MQGSFIEAGELCTDLENALKKLAQNGKGEIVSAISPIIKTNCEKGRVQGFVEHGSVENVEAYVFNVAANYSELNCYLSQLQEEQDPVMWEELFSQLQEWAFYILTKKQFATVNERHQHSLQCAADAGTAVANTYFPYDTSFESWAYVIVRNVCLSHIRKTWNGVSIPQKATVPLDNWDEWIDNISSVDPFVPII